MSALSKRAIGCAQAHCRKITTYQFRSGDWESLTRILIEDVEDALEIWFETGAEGATWN